MCTQADAHTHAHTHTHTPCQLGIDRTRDHLEMQPQQLVVSVVELRRCVTCQKATISKMLLSSHLDELKKSATLGRHPCICRHPVAGDADGCEILHTAQAERGHANNAGGAAVLVLTAW